MRDKLKNERYNEKEGSKQEERTNEKKYNEM
jgi:hypothetical protein